MKDAGSVNLNGMWISSEDLHLNRLMRDRRNDTLCKVLSAVIVFAMIVFAAIIAWR